ncbi:hypothetical protein OG601_47540 [Streptomyces sp. NBC_01239]|uniref:hypothetical protein n=1 Tax=Streptomyces sp. NBC_01239 TaxID=2903792 RepID=UPI00224E2CDD|nr:hypothetical protein [Streptomyces sp. NBC_01239]MCX4816782.1 hypothetical protein [Streptomyces sp. NBC_01239]MCX4818230.1 hypothetical protein [Streptomyces sp. NBC_01239]
MKSQHGVHRDLKAALQQQARRAGEQSATVRGSDWRLATVTAVGTTGTVTADGLTVRCMESYLQPTVGDVIVVDQNSAGNLITRGRLATGTDPIGATRSAPRTTDLQRANTNVPASDPQMTLPVTANARYTLDAYIKYSGVNDVLIGWAVPSGTLGEWQGLGNGIVVTSATAGGGTQQDAISTWGYSVRTESTDIANTRTYGAVGTTAFGVQIRGTVRVGATAGNFAVAWAQGASGATATFVYTDSWLRLHRFA